MHCTVDLIDFGNTFYEVKFTFLSKFAKKLNTEE